MEQPILKVDKLTKIFTRKGQPSMKAVDSIKFHHCANKLAMIELSVVSSGPSYAADVANASTRIARVASSSIFASISSESVSGTLAPFLS